MPLEPAFTLSATNPYSNGYDAGAPTASYVTAHVSGYGVFAGSSTPWELSAQFANDEVIIGYDPVDPADENDITDVYSQLMQRNTFRCYIYGYNVRDDHQYLLVFGFKKRAYLAATVQFFVGTEWVLSETIDDDTETVALLLDAPGPGSVFVYARLASQSVMARVGLTGIEGFII